MNAKDSFTDKSQKKKPYYRNDFKKRVVAASYQPEISFINFARENSVSVSPYYPIGANGISN